MAARKTTARKVVNVSKALDAPRDVCPFSGEPLQYVETSSGWQVRGKNWVSTEFYPFKDLAEWAFSHNEGVIPAFPNPYRRVGVKGEREPEQPGVADVLEANEKLEADLTAEAEAVLKQE